MTFPRDQIAGTVPERLKRVAEAHPDEPAIEAEDGRYNYVQLTSRIGRIAQELQERLPGPPQPIALLFEHGAAPVVSILAVLEAGHIYLPLDPADPEKRIRQILEHSETELLLADSQTAELAARAALGLSKVLNVDELDGHASSRPAPIGPDSPASLYYTSGSTGAPKGVLSSHRTRLVNAYWTARALELTHRDRFALLYPSRYAGAVNATFGALLNGACLLPFDFRRKGAWKLAAWLEEQRITVYHSVPPIFRQMVKGAGRDLRFFVHADRDAGKRLGLSERPGVVSERFPNPCVFANSWGVSESPLFRPALFGHERIEAGSALPAVGTANERPARRG